jgi:hypothetical protein
MRPDTHRGRRAPDSESAWYAGISGGLGSCMLPRKRCLRERSELGWAPDQGFKICIFFIVIGRVPGRPFGVFLAGFPRAPLGCSWAASGLLLGSLLACYWPADVAEIGCDSRFVVDAVLTCVPGGRRAPDSESAWYAGISGGLGSCRLPRKRPGTIALPVDKYLISYGQLYVSIGIP